MWTFYLTIVVVRDFRNKFSNIFKVVVVVVVRDESLEEKVISKENLSKYGKRLREKIRS